ncbi:MAG TPA: hypothetical protein DD383_01920 [Rikenellaceae bacterium]|nr:hypothetical protein [Rikenellaceae bacterium]
MRQINILLAAVAVFVTAASCEKTDYGAPDKDKYIYDIPQTTLGSDAILGCYYSNYTSEVASKIPEIPSLGFYKTLDEGVIARHISWADQAGLDFFILNWNGTSGDKSLVEAFMTARESESNVRFILCYDTKHLNVTNESPLESENKYKSLIAEFVDELSVYMLDDSYFKIDGRPVIMFTPSNLSSDALLSIDYKKVIDGFRTDFESFYGVDPFVIGQITTGWVAPVNYADHQIYSFDAVVANAWKTRSYDVFFGFFSFLDINWNNWKTTLEKRAVDFIPCVYPSYNDRVKDTKSYYYTFAADGDVKDYVKFCNVAKRNIGSHNLIFINSWNDWAYGTNLEPSDLKETRFLDETRKQFKKQ